MKRTVIIILAAVMLLSLVSCKFSVGNSDSTTAAPGGNSGDATQGGSSDKTSEIKIDDLKIENIKKIVTDVVPVDPSTSAAIDFACTDVYVVYDFSEADEIKSYTRTYTTDPSKYEDTNRRLTDGNYAPVWSDDHTQYSTVGKYGIGMERSDIVDSLKKDGISFTAYMKDGSSVHVTIAK